MTKLYSICFFLLVQSMIGLTQDNDLDILNSVITDLVGNHKNEDIPLFKSLEEACQTDYIGCNKRKTKITSLYFPFTNLNGHIPEEICLLKDISSIDLSYNYLKGVIPEGLNKLDYLSNLNLKGNFISGPLPPDLGKVLALVDLSENSIKTEDKKSIAQYKIIDQINLEECRSPDSIFISREDPYKILDAVTPDNSKEETLNNEENTKPSHKKEADDSESGAYTVVESMPRFPGCEKKDMSNEEKQECANMEMLQFIYKRLKYPAIARENGNEGMVIVQFVINKNGEIMDANIIRDVGGGCGNAGLWIINRMNYLCDPWTPGMQRDEAVKVLYTLPIKFKLEG